MSHLSQKAKSREQLANEYGICSRTLRRWLKKSQIKLPNRLISPKDQIRIYETFGYPKGLDIEKHSSK